MTLFEECKESLSEDFTIIENDSIDDVTAMLKQYPFKNGNVVWSEIKYADYRNINEILEMDIVKNSNVFVLADDIDIPIFKTNLRLLSENIYEVLALSPKIFIFNKNLLMQPLFPTENIRLGVKD